MDDKHIEDLLRESWSPCPPDGMRDRILRNSRSELARNRHPKLHTNWKFALVTLSVFIVLATDISDYARQNRLSNMVGGPPSGAQVSPTNLRERQRYFSELMAKSIPDDLYLNDRQRKGTL